MNTSEGTPNFEALLNELKNIVERIEQGDLMLEEALQNFEKGISISKQCQKALQQAEQKVKILTIENGEECLQDFNALNEDD